MVVEYLAGSTEEVEGSCLVFKRLVVVITAKTSGMIDSLMTSEVRK